MKIVEDLAHTPDPTEVDLARYKYYIQVRIIKWYHFQIYFSSK